MSHYTVAVISKDLKEVEKLLEPYGIYNLGGAEKITYTRDEVVSRYRNKLEEYNKLIYSKYLLDKEAFIEENKYHPRFLEYIEKGFLQDFKRSDDDIYEDIARHILSIIKEKDGSISLDYNPDGKYARYSIQKTPHTSWDFKTEDGSVRRNYKGRVKDLVSEREPLHKERTQLSDYWNRTVNNPEKQKEILELDDVLPDEIEYYKMCCEKRDVMIDTYGDFESYLKYENMVQSFAVVTPDGKWHENAVRDWFGNVGDSIENPKEWVDNYYDRFIKPYRDYFITFIVFAEY
ncbi:MAG: hypothetical protein Q4F66_00740 [Clostridium sp.]|nr:hypothetical protein [Clostridium sp.]